MNRVRVLVLTRWTTRYPKRTAYPLLAAAERTTKTHESLQVTKPGPEMCLSQHPLPVLVAREPRLQLYHRLRYVQCVPVRFLSSISLTVCVVPRRMLPCSQFPRKNSTGGDLRSSLSTLTQLLTRTPTREDGLRYSTLTTCCAWLMLLQDYGGVMANSDYKSDVFLVPERHLERSELRFDDSTTVYVKPLGFVTQSIRKNSFDLVTPLPKSMPGRPPDTYR
jgi:hypothetical protein